MNEKYTTPRDTKNVSFADDTQQQNKDIEVFVKIHQLTSENEHILNKLTKTTRNVIIEKSKPRTHVDAKNELYRSFILNRILYNNPKSAKHNSRFKSQRQRRKSTSKTPFCLI